MSSQESSGEGSQGGLTTEGVKATGAQGWRAEQCSHKPRNASRRQKLKEAREDSSLESLEGTSPANTLAIAQ